MNITKKFARAVAMALAIVLLTGIVVANRFGDFSAATVKFDDVKAGAWYYADVNLLAEKGVVSGVGAIKGVGNNCFRPEGNVTGAEMTKMVVNAFFREDYNSFEAARYDMMRTRFGDQLYWYSFMAYYAKMANLGNGVHLLDGVDMDIDSYASCNKPMSRYDMAMILANAAKAKGMTVTETQKTAAQAGINDYSSIPAKYQDAVVTCYALQTKNAEGKAISLLTGDNGYFYGSRNITRAQACAVIVRLDNLVINGNSNVDPDPVVTPVTPEPTVKEIQVSSEYWSGNNNLIGGGQTSGNAWTITDNGFGDGYLNNGKPITVENVIELLHEAEKIWPAGITWTLKGSGNNFYKSSGSVVSKMLDKPNTGTTIKESSNFACGGFAAMISDYIFGRDNNNFHRVTDMNDIRPGDIIIRIDPNTNTIVHVFMAVTTPGNAYTGLQGTTAVTRAGFFHLADGNTSNKVTWPNMYSAPISKTNETEYTWQVYSRYPA